MSFYFFIIVVLMLIFIMAGMSVLYDKLESIQEELKELRLRTSDDKGAMIGSFHWDSP